MNPQHSIKGLLTSVNGWIGKKLGVEDEEELLTPDLLQDGKRSSSSGKSSAQIPACDSAPPTRAVPFAPAASPDKAPTPELVQPARSSQPAGLHRKTAGQIPDSGQGIYQSSADDSQYKARNLVVALIRQRYIKYGETMAAAMLSRALSEKGLALLLQKLDIQPSGRETWDHDRIESLINEIGLEEFCKRAGIRYEAIAEELDKREVQAARISGTQSRDESVPSSSSIQEGQPRSRALILRPRPKPSMNQSNSAPARRAQSAPGDSIKPVSLAGDEAPQRPVTPTPRPQTPRPTAKGPVALTSLNSGIVPTRLGAESASTVTEQASPVAPSSAPPSGPGAPAGASPSGESPEERSPTDSTHNLAAKRLLDDELESRPGESDL